MRLLLLLMISALCWSAEYVELLLRDGRKLEGWYDTDTEELKIGPGTIKISSLDIITKTAKEEPAVKELPKADSKPEPDVVTRIKGAKSTLDAAFEESEKRNKQARRDYVEEVAKLAQFLDLATLTVPSVGPDPRKSELQAADEIKRLNDLLTQIAQRKAEGEPSWTPLSELTSRADFLALYRKYKLRAH